MVANIVYENIVALNINFPTNELLQRVLQEETHFLKKFTSNMMGISKESEEEGVLILYIGTLVDHCGVVRPCNWHVRLP
jgi:hypothetical protein